MAVVALCKGKNQLPALSYPYGIHYAPNHTFCLPENPEKQVSQLVIKVPQFSMLTN